MKSLLSSGDFFLDYDLNVSLSSLHLNTNTLHKPLKNNIDHEYKKQYTVNIIAFNPNNL
jgi:hypothetical protein